MALALGGTQCHGGTAQEPGCREGACPCCQHLGRRDSELELNRQHGLHCGTQSDRDKAPSEGPNHTRPSVEIQFFRFLCEMEHLRIQRFRLLRLLQHQHLRINICRGFILAVFS